MVCKRPDPDNGVQRPAVEDASGRDLGASTKISEVYRAVRNAGHGLGHSRAGVDDAES
jgi:hypothetical protein